MIREKMEKDPENLDNRREEMYFTQKLNKETDRMAANADFIAQLYKMSMLKDRIVMGDRVTADLGPDKCRNEKNYSVF